VSSALPSCVVDTVVLRYFLLADEADLLLDALGRPAGTPRIVYDPDEGDVPDEARSEITRSIAYHRQAAADPARDAIARDQVATNAKRLRGVTELYSTGDLMIMDMAAEEHAIFGQATSPNGCGSYGLRFPLGLGEAACLAMALARNLPLVTDDGDALRALRHISPHHPYQRVRKLLIHAAEQGRITRSRANAVHRDMTALGLWDVLLPFPGEP
jgi:hypothetical protein